MGINSFTSLETCSVDVGVCKNILAAHLWAVNNKPALVRMAHKVAAKQLNYNTNRKNISKPMVIKMARVFCNARVFFKRWFFCYIHSASHRVDTEPMIRDVRPGDSFKPLPIIIIYFANEHQHSYVVRQQLTRFDPLDVGWFYYLCRRTGVGVKMTTNCFWVVLVIGINTHKYI